MRCFVLVHGAYHGDWCWDLLRPELELRGCNLIVVDLPTGDPSAAAEAYARTVAASIPDDARAVVAVGHSLGGLTIPLPP
jgi:pimeloyl-ACP methyl ester carboxylesterase